MPAKPSPLAGEEQDERVPPPPLPLSVRATSAEAAEEIKRSGMEGVDDDEEYLRSHSHPRSHPHEKEPEGRLLHALYALEGGDPESEVDVIHEPEAAQGWFSFRTLLSYTGPGFLMCIAYLDPGNLEADLQVGAYTGYSLLWMLALATLMGLALQCMAARLGVVTGKNLARVCKENYGRKTSLALWFLIELAIIGCDLQEIVGSAVAFQVLFGFPLWLGCLITFVDTFTFLGIHYWGVRKLEGLFVMLVSIMTVCFFLNFGKAPPPSADVARGFIPEIKPYAVLSAVGLIGAVIMPHNIYLHSALVLSRKVNRRSPAQVREANKYFAIDSGIALTVSFVINLAVVSVFAYHFFDPVCASADTSNPLACLSRDAAGVCDCQEIGLSQAHDALAGVLGKSAKYVWGVGLLAAGQSSTMTGTYAGQYVMEGFLDLKIPVWMRVTFTRLVAIGPGLLVAILTQDNQNLSDKFQQWLNVLQSVLLSFSLLPVLHFTSSQKIMGEHRSGTPLTVSIWMLALGVLAINIYLVISRVGGGQPWWAYAIAAVAGLAYLAFSYSLVSEDIARGYQTFLAWLPPNARRYFPWSGPSPSSAAAGGAVAPSSPGGSGNLANPLIDPAAASGGSGSDSDSGGEGEGAARAVGITSS